MLGRVGLRHDPAQHRPLAGIDPAREGPAAGNDVATIDRARLARREDQRGRDQHVRVRPPDFVLHLRLEEREHPVVGEQIGQVPGAGRAGTGDDGAEIDEDAVVELRTADAGRLEHAEEPVLVERGLGLGRQTPQRLRRSGAFAQARQQSLGPLQNRVSRIGTVGIRGIRARGIRTIRRHAFVHDAARCRGKARGQGSALCPFAEIGTVGRPDLPVADGAARRRHKPEVAIAGRSEWT